MNRRLPRPLCAPILALFYLGLSACDGSSDDAKEADGEPCGGNGELYESHGHCHCDDGFDLSPDGMDCVPSADDASDDGQGGADGDGSGDGGTDFEPGSVVGILYGGDSPYQVLTAKHGRTWLSIENYPDLGGLLDAESRPIGATEASYATCGVCLLVQTGCQQHGDHAHCDTTYMPEVGGEITFDALGEDLGEAWSGTLAEVRFVEVTINPRSFETNPVPNGETFDLGTWEFDVLLESN